MIRGTVVRGEGKGKGLGYPTANINVSVASTKLSPGIYASFAILRNQSYLAALVIHEVLDKIEVFFMDYQGPDFYGEEIAVEAVQRLSALERLDTEEERKEKIENDVELVREFFAEKG